MESIIRNNKILAIAIDGYEHEKLNTLNNCKTDIEKILKVLNEKYIFKETEFIYKKEETKGAMLFQRLNEYFRNATNDENVLLIYAGHGQYDDELKTAYWQPSDSSPSNSFGWINLNTILSFIKVSKAHHVSIISDSCFSGALFDNPLRGGGVVSFNGKKSRQALTSGSIEKVSDGIKGESSPFAKVLVDVLEKNNDSELPFDLFCYKVKVDFNTEKQQTPQYGNLTNVGHEGGSFVFELQKEDSKTITDKDKYLKEHLKNLYIEIPKAALELIKKLEPISDLKTETVRKQDYETAAKLRDTEKQLESQLFNELHQGIIELGDKYYKNLIYTPDELKEKKDLEQELIDYKKLIEEENIETVVGATRITKTTIFKTLLKSRGWYFYNNPFQRYFIKNKDIYYEVYSKGITQLYLAILKDIGFAKDTSFKEPFDEFNLLLTQIIKYEIDLIQEKRIDDFDKKLIFLNLETNVLNWIKTGKTNFVKDEHF